MNELTAAIVLSSQGVPFIHAGEELLRTKVKPDGTFDHNSYASTSSLNSIKWDDLNKAEYEEVYNYYKGLIEFRKNHSALRMSKASDVNKYMDIFMDGSDDQNVIAYKLSGDANNEVSDGIVVIFNPSSEATTVELPEGDWKICVDGNKAGTEVLGTATGSVEVTGVSSMILVNGATKLSDVDENQNDVTGDDVTTVPGSTASDESPTTGDSQLATILFVILAASIVCVTVSVVLGKKKQAN